MNKIFYCCRTKAIKFKENKIKQQDKRLRLRLLKLGEHLGNICSNNKKIQIVVIYFLQ